MISPIPRLLRAAGSGEVAALAEDTAELVGGGAVVEELVDSATGDSFVGVGSFFSIGLFELCRRWDLFPFVVPRFRSDEDRLFPGRRPAEMTRSDITRRIATVYMICVVDERDD